MAEVRVVEVVTEDEFVRNMNMGGTPRRRHAAWLLLGLIGLSAVSLTACRGSNATAQRGEAKPTLTTNYLPKARPPVERREVQLVALQVPEPIITEAEYINDDELCMTCHETYVKSFKHNVHRGQSCEKCHGPGSRHLQTRGKEPDTILSFRKLTPPQKSELCLKCHTQNQCAPGADWRTSKHAHHGVSCTDCHTSHYNVPPGTKSTSLPGEDTAAVPGKSTQSELRLVNYQDDVEPSMDELRARSNNLGAVEPHICFKCHANYRDLTRVAHPHQIGGPNGFQCSTCHNPHGQIKPETRTELCMTCHKGSPTMAWHSATHALYGVACTDCHNPHPASTVQSLTNISHTHVQRAQRLPMSVDDPGVCYKCHQKTYMQNAMPSHHPIKEGKMFCKDCHDPHGQQQGNLRDATTNMVCYRCHADKQGPFAYEHPPVTENCGICHNPHGTVANNLLHQPTTFLCLRCHSGHRTTPGHPGSPPFNDTGLNPGMQRGFYSDCTQCHAQVHGSDLPGPHRAKSLTR